MNLTTQFFRFDNLSIFVGIFVGIFFLLITIYSFGFMWQRKKLIYYYSYLILTFISSLGAVFSNNLILFMVFWGFLGWFGYNYILNNKEYKKYRDLYDESLEDSDLGDPNYKAYRNFYQDQRDEWAVWFLLTYLLNLVDAYVDAHLFDFDVTENPYYKSPQINIRLNLN